MKQKRRRTKQQESRPRRAAGDIRVTPPLEWLHADSTAMLALRVLLVAMQASTFLIRLHLHN